MNWHEALARMAENEIPFSLQFDTNYGLDRRQGWTLTVDGKVYSSLVDSPTQAVFDGLMNLIMTLVDEANK